MNKTLENIDNVSRALLLRAKKAILNVEPEAKIFLFGSRARADATKNSDWDLLIVLPGEVSQNRKSLLLNRFYDFQLAELTFFDIIIVSEDDTFEDGDFIYTPFYQEISKESITV